MGGRGRERIAARLGHRFKRPELLAQALTHPGAATAGRGGVGDYERLEFLGDRVLGLVIAAALLARFPKAEPGGIARRYNALVRREALVEVAEALDLGAHLTLAKGERQTGGGAKPSILADACEALIGALYLDGGLEPARAFIERFWEPRMEALAGAPKDAKTRLQEWGQARDKAPPVYRQVAREGPPHSPRFTIEAVLDGVPPARGEGRSKRAAEHAAAEAMLAALAAEGRLDDT